MREFFITICPMAIWFIVAAEGLIAALLFFQAKRHSQPVALWSGVLTIGLILDAAIIGLGTALPESILSISATEKKYPPLNGHGMSTMGCAIRSEDTSKK